jgi:hypothetical protein
MHSAVIPGEPTAGDGDPYSGRAPWIPFPSLGSAGNDGCQATARMTWPTLSAISPI